MGRKVHRRLKAFLLCIAALLGGVGLTVLMPTSPAYADDGGYPYANYAGPGTVASQWVWTDANGQWYSDRYRMAYRNCTDYVAWKLDVTNDWYVGVTLGNAVDWKAWAQATPRNYPVNMTPAPGAVAWWGGHTWNGGYGHVAYVLSVSADGQSVNLGEYNFAANGVYGTRTIAKNQVDGYIHFKDLSGSSGGSSGGSTGTDNYFHGTPPDGAVIENHDGGLHKYVAIGGSLVWIPPETIWGYVDQMHNKFPAGHPFREIVWMHNDDIHALEYGYGGDRSHVPADNSFFYEAGGAQQYVIQYRYAFSIDSTDEVSYLGGVNKAVMVPPGLATRLAGTPDVPNDVLLKSLPDPAYYHQVNGTAFWADNFTVIDCIRTVKGGGIQPVPSTLLGKLWSVGKLSTQKTSCSFPPNWALYGPGGAERWWIDGANPYTRHHYSSSLALRCRLGSSPIEVQLPDAAGVNQPTEAEPLDCPNNTYVRIAGNGEVFQVVDGWLHYVTSPASLSCLTAGHPEVVINIDGAVVATTPRGSNAYCTLEGKQLQAPSGQIDYVKDGARRHVLNWAIVNCLKGRSATGDPIVVDQATFNGYTDSGVNAYCPYEKEAGLNFVQEQGSPIVWLVGPAAGGAGMKRHAGSLCVNDPYTTPIKAAHVFTVPAGETAGHTQGPDWWPSGADCQALPQG